MNKYKAYNLINEKLNEKKIPKMQLGPMVGFCKKWYSKACQRQNYLKEETIKRIGEILELDEKEKEILSDLIKKNYRKPAHYTSVRSERFLTGYNYSKKTVNNNIITENHAKMDLDKILDVCKYL